MSVNEFGIDVKQYEAASAVERRNMLVASKRKIQTQLAELKLALAEAKGRLHRGDPIPKHDYHKLHSNLDATRLRANRIDAAIAELSGALPRPDGQFAKVFMTVARHVLDAEEFSAVMQATNAALAEAREVAAIAAE